MIPNGPTKPTKSQQPCEVERTTMSLSSNSARRRCGLSIRRATQRGGSVDQVFVEQLSESVVSIRSLPSNSARRGSQSGTVDPRQPRQDASSPNFVRTSGTHTEGVPRVLCRRDNTSPHTLFSASHLRLVGPTNPIMEHLSIRVSIVTHILARTKQYTIPVVHLRTLKG